MAVMCGLCLSVHVLKLPQAFMLSPELLLFRQVECEIKGFVLSGVYLTPQYLTSQFPYVFLAIRHKKGRYRDL